MVFSQSNQDRQKNMVMKTFQIFSAGTFTSMSGKTLNFSESDIATMAASYSAATRPANLVIGHPSNDLPAYGTVKKLFDKGGRLYAIADVGNTLIDLVTAGFYRKVSASFMPIARAGNWYLRHVGFLGAMPPSVKGMDSLKFSESDNGDFCFSEPGSICFSESNFDYSESGDSPGRQAFHHAALTLDRRTGMGYGEAVQAISNQANARHVAASYRACGHPRAALHTAVINFMEAVPDASYSEALTQIEAAGMRL